MKSDSCAVFVYGLLMCPEIVHAITGKRYSMQSAVLADHKRFGVSQQPGDIALPALTDYPGYLQQGQLLTGVLAAELELLDFFEELDSGLYLRQQVRVQTGDQWLDAWCYKVGPALAPYLVGDWSPEQVSSAQKQHLLTTLIPSMLDSYHNLRARPGN